jgi:hypothetical protein
MASSSSSSDDDFFNCGEDMEASANSTSEAAATSKSDNSSFGNNDDGANLVTPPTAVKRGFYDMVNVCSNTNEDPLPWQQPPVRATILCWAMMIMVPIWLHHQQQSMVKRGFMIWFMCVQNAPMYTLMSQKKSCTKIIDYEWPLIEGPGGNAMTVDKSNKPKKHLDYCKDCSIVLFGLNFKAFMKSLDSLKTSSHPAVSQTFIVEPCHAHISTGSNEMSKSRCQSCCCCKAEDKSKVGIETCSSGVMAVSAVAMQQHS